MPILLPLLGGYAQTPNTTPHYHNPPHPIPARSRPTSPNFHPAAGLLMEVPQKAPCLVVDTNAIHIYRPITLEQEKTSTGIKKEVDQLLAMEERTTLTFNHVDEGMVMETGKSLILTRMDGLACRAVRYEISGSIFL